MSCAMRLASIAPLDTKARWTNCRKAGTLKYVEVKPNLDLSLFPALAVIKPSGSLGANLNTAQLPQRHGDNPGFKTALEVYQEDKDEFWENSIDDVDLVAAGNFACLREGNGRRSSFATAGDLEFEHIDRYADTIASEARKNTVANGRSKQQALPTSQSEIELDGGDSAARRLENGKWACNHRCRDKTK
jgi:ATP-dependent DNA helicase HFM1/MER3